MERISHQCGWKTWKRRTEKKWRWRWREREWKNKRKQLKITRVQGVSLFFLTDVPNKTKVLVKGWWWCWKQPFCFYSVCILPERRFHKFRSDTRVKCPSTHLYPRGVLGGCGKEEGATVPVAPRRAGPTISFSFFSPVRAFSIRADSRLTSRACVSYVLFPLSFFFVLFF